MNANAPSGVSLSRIAHDLRGPLMPLRTAAWLLRQEQEGSARLLELADIVERQSIRLARMMDELSEWGRASAEHSSLSLVPVDVPLVVDTALGGIPGCHVEPVITDDAARFPLHADPHRLATLLGTLIEHACRRDGVNVPEISLDVADGRLRIRVRDHGEPMDANARAALLSQRQDQPFDEGLGLRLLIAGKIATAHQGSLEVDPTILDGLALTCLLPAGG